MSDEDVVSCTAHPKGPVEGCEPCRIVGGDILSCPEHPNGPVDGCKLCDVIVDVWVKFFGELS